MNLSNKLIKGITSLICVFSILLGVTNVLTYASSISGEEITNNANVELTTNEAPNDIAEISSSMSDGNIISKTFYTYYDGSSMFISDASKDSAQHSSKLNDFNSGLITMEDWHEFYSVYSLSFSEPNTNVSLEENQNITQAVANGKIVVRGKMTWMTENNNELPLRFTYMRMRLRLYEARISRWIYLYFLLLHFT